MCKRIYAYMYVYVCDCACVRVCVNVCVCLQVSLVYPMGLAASAPSAADPFPLLFISDQLQRRILRADLGALDGNGWDHQQRNVSSHVLFQRHPQATQGKCGKAHAADFNYPRGIALTNSHQLLVADGDGRRVRVVQNLLFNSSSNFSSSWTAEIRSLRTMLSIYADSAETELLSPAGVAVRTPLCS